MTDMDDRVRQAEKWIAVHEAVCLERYKAIENKLNIIVGLMISLLAAAVAGNPVIDFVRRAFHG